ncbi:MAG: DUF5675 family protein, partial [Bacteroidota bacterium]
WINAVKIDDTGKAIVKVKLRKKSDEDYKKQQEALKDDKQARLFLKVTCQGDDRKHKIAFGEHFKLIVGDDHTIFVTRKWEYWSGQNSNSATIGELRFGKIIGYVCEPHGPETTVRGQDKRVPVGEYKFKWHTSTNFPKDKYVSIGRPVLIMDFQNYLIKTYLKTEVF